jgi:hypothetical protein
MCPTPPTDRLEWRRYNKYWNIQRERPLFFAEKKGDYTPISSLAHDWWLVLNSLRFTNGRGGREGSRRTHKLQVTAQGKGLLLMFDV